MLFLRACLLYLVFGSVVLLNFSVMVQDAVRQDGQWSARLPPCQQVEQACQGSSYASDEGASVRLLLWTTSAS